ncbi:hypothetical protein [Sediminibacterium goheungense]|uniref:DUF3592 domain-containing protein n=1 Tax=Sediminibacterium goheungense TaxID=1086393 RepID=A0A4R6J0C2_9BACT|nr:hypothetical protein [Sediminibacterium goheungense]TDO28247.1 hypothetical protein BC659_0310 [Sediminibacterium goheungense]
MYKSIFILYVVCFGCYILFTRQPDYFDGVKVPATIQMEIDASSGDSVLKAVFNTGTKEFAINPHYPLRTIKAGQQVTVIYETGNPSMGQLYSGWGYWWRWDELVVSSILCFLLFQVAISVTSNPNPEALVEQLEYKEEKKKKYLD